jgi:hypothetical protein
MASNGVCKHGAGMAFVMTGLLAFFYVQSADAQIFSNLQSLVYQVRTGDPALSTEADGPKSIGTADFDGDGKEDLAVSNTDGSVTVFYGLGSGRFSQPLHLHTGARGLRGILCADLTGDGRVDIAVAAPFSSKIFIFPNNGGRAFSTASELTAWYGVRNLIAADFNGDGRIDLAAAGPNMGLEQWSSVGGGVFVPKATFPALNYSFSEPGKFPKPFYAMALFRPASTNRHYLLATHAETNRIWMLTANQTGALDIYTTFTNRSKAHGLAVGPLLHPASSPIPDLISVAHDAGVLEVRAGLSTAPYFEAGVNQRIDIPGGPRWVQIVDLNQDGWNDLVVAQREQGTIVTYINNNGVLRLASERPVGISPREMVTSRLDDDVFPDLAVMNRSSADVSILLAYPQQGGYRGVNHLYLVDGNVAGLAVYDFNKDGRDDVIQLHRSSGDFSVRLANPDGTLQSPVYYTVGNVPSSQVFADVNHDGISDQITANLGAPRTEKGSVSIRLGRGDGTFGAERRLELPAGVDGRLFALVPGDFDGDGNIDLAAGFLDNRIAFFRGHGDGSLTFTRAHLLDDPPRAILAGDFDKDQDLDLAVVGANGTITVIENKGNLLDSVQWITHVTPPPGTNSETVRTAILTDHDADGNLDIVVGSGNDAWLYKGTGGLVFSHPPESIATLSHPVSDFLFADLDGDGRKELVISCRDLDCLSVFTPNGNGSYAFALSMDAPASRFLATGDLDGDGKPDLVGSGRILWTALSSHSPQTTAPLSFTGQRAKKKSLVINELLAKNTALPVDPDGGRTVEWVELFNGGDTSDSLKGWKLRSIGANKTGEPVTNDFAFPPTAFSTPGKYLMVYYSEIRRTVYHTGFKIPESGTLILLNSSGSEIDRVDYSAQRENISYGRYRDAIHSFVLSAFPSPGKANDATGLIEPALNFSGVDPASIYPGKPIKFFAEADAQIGIASLVMYYQRLDEPNSEIQKMYLFDDGLHGDGDAGDGIFAGTLEGSLPWGAEIQYFFEVTDLDDQVVTVPDEPEFGVPGLPGNVYQLAINSNRPPLEISEVVPWNISGLMDEYGGHPDWVEVRNTSSAPLQMTGISLAHQIGDDSPYFWPTGSVLLPKEHSVVLCDNNPEQGPAHAPMKLSRSGDIVMLLGRTANKSPTVIDWVQFGSIEGDTAFARLGVGGNWRMLPPTPGACNLSEAGIVFLETNSVPALFTIAFATRTNSTYVIERTQSVQAVCIWVPVETCEGDGFEKVHTEPLAPSGFFRVRRSE